MTHEPIAFLLIASPRPLSRTFLVFAYREWRSIALPLGLMYLLSMWKKSCATLPERGSRCAAERRRQSLVDAVGYSNAACGGAGRHVSAASKRSVSGIGFVRCCREGVPAAHVDVSLCREGGPGAVCMEASLSGCGCYVDVRDCIAVIGNGTARDSRGVKRNQIGTESQER